MSFKLPPLQTVTQCASLVTATRAIWELSRMVRQKKREVEQTKEVEDLLDEIEEFVHEGVLTKREWKAFCANVEEALSKKECTPREAQAKVLDFLEALHSIAQEFQEEDRAYHSEPEDVDQVPHAHHHRIEHKAPQPRRDSAVNTSRDSQSRSRTAAYPPSPRLPRSHTAPASDLRPRRASAPMAHHHYHAPPASTAPATPGGSVSGIPHVPVTLPSQFQNGQHYRAPRHVQSVPSSSAVPAASGAFSPGAGAGAFSPGHMLPNQPTYYPNVPPSMFAPGTASPFVAGNGGTASRAYSYGGAASSPEHMSPTSHVNATVSPPHPNYSGPLPVPPSRSFNQPGWAPLPTQTPGGPTSPASTVSAHNTWTANTTFPFPSFPENRSRDQGNSNSNRPSAGPSPSHSHRSPVHQEARTPASYSPPANPASSAASSPIVPPSSPGGSTSARTNGWDGSQQGSSPRGFMSPTQEAQAQRTAAAKLREHEHRQRQAQALSEEISVPDLDIPPPPNATPRHRKQQKSSSSVKWASGFDNEDDEKKKKVNNDARQTDNPPPSVDSVSEAGTYMSPIGEKNKRRRRKQ
ncbi:wiskott-aldrich syndrome protein family member 2 [Diplodia corticola]|uniref:Wiskott-aldrich syndrome protein family member 2 n=1 Tax=Diplodia corticola TaxID=236234 RepID=A0A1J9QNV0_9PEZI|nr:wiskott-aldrich syndrome protein family member 2 [Diplodia corticola]OJD29730.1 wiskott-aldrich syndrome protein family member 2 [Diplodia corticola]